jgi:hypothetical protein
MSRKRGKRRPERSPLPWPGGRSEKVREPRPGDPNGRRLRAADAPAGTSREADRPAWDIFGDSAHVTATLVEVAKGEKEAAGGTIDTLPALRPPRAKSKSRLSKDAILLIVIAAVLASAVGMIVAKSIDNTRVINAFLVCDTILFGLILVVPRFKTLVAVMRGKNGP